MSLTHIYYSLSSPYSIGGTVIEHQMHCLHYLQTLNFISCVFNRLRFCYFFRDVATLHYDPSREDHKHFELEKPTTIDEGEDEVGKEKKGYVRNDYVCSLNS